MFTVSGLKESPYTITAVRPMASTGDYLRCVIRCLYRTLWLIALYLLPTIGLGP